MASRPGRKIPPPADPFERREPLPSPLPEIARDPDAAARIGAILESPSYRVASEDIDFLGSDTVRGLRLQMDYLKPELLLRAKTSGGRSSSSAVRGSASRTRRAAASKSCGARGRRSGNDGDNAPTGDRRTRSRQEPLLRRRARIRPHRRRRKRPHRRRTDPHRDGRRPRHHGGRQPRRVRRRGEDDRAQHQPAARAIPEPLRVAGSVLQLPLFRHAQAALPTAGDGARRLSRRLRHA